MCSNVDLSQFLISIYYSHGILDRGCLYKMSLINKGLSTGFVHKIHSQYSMKTTIAQVVGV